MKDIFICGSAGRIGGICGYNDGTIKKCYNVGTITGSAENVGGIAGTNGLNSAGHIENVYNTGEITGINNVGGIVGENITVLSTVEHAYNKGTITGPTNVGGIIGTNSATYTNCYYMEGTTAYGIGSSSSDTDKKTLAEMSSQEFLELLGIENWKIVPSKNDGYPILKL